MEKEYTNGETTIIWKPEKCIHSGVCLVGLHKVFNLQQRPWISMDGADTATIEAQVARCPSGALTIKGQPQLRQKLLDSRDVAKEGAEITLVKGGPVIVNGLGQVKNTRGRVKEEGQDLAFCRCGKSENFPYCDGTHAKHLKP